MAVMLVGFWVAVFGAVSILLVPFASVWWWASLACCVGGVSIQVAALRALGRAP